MPLSICFIIFFSFAGAESGEFGMSSIPPTALTLQMIIDFAEQENWKQVIFFDCTDNNDCSRTYATSLMNCFADYGIQLLMKSVNKNTDITNFMKNGVDRLGVVILLDGLGLDTENNLFNKLMPRNRTIRMLALGRYVSWLAVSTRWNTTQVINAVKEWPIGVDTEYSISMTSLTADIIFNLINQFPKRICRHLQEYAEKYDYNKLARSQGTSPPDITLIQESNDTYTLTEGFFIVSVYKFRTDNNDTLEIESRNFWTPSLQYIRAGRANSKMRTNFQLNRMNIGLHNITNFYPNSEDVIKVDRTSSVGSLQELIVLFQKCLNISTNVSTFWTDQGTASIELLNGIFNGNIDFGAAYYDPDLQRQDLLSFSLPIVHYKRSIYFKPPEATSNIFLQPFSKKMLLCVLATLVLIVGVMEIINYVTLFIHLKEDREHFGLGEATLWCISIMCMQGSPWTPRTRAGKTVLLGSLIFSLMIYNSYSGSITSILSVKTVAINNISDFFKYDYVFACSKVDDVYISSKQELRSFYVKALENNQLKVSVETGLDKSMRGGYAFFVTETIAKRILRSTLAFHRCNINELQTNTPGTLALPISNDSPYKKIINISILRLWQYGILPKLSLQIKPPLLNCEGVLKYNQAHLMDVYGAFVILIAGAMAAGVIFLLERIWASRQKLRDIQMRITGKTEDVVSMPNNDDNKLKTPRLSMTGNDVKGDKSDKNLRTTGNELPNKGTDSVKARDAQGGLPKPRLRMQELTFIKYPDKNVPLLPYCP